MKFLITAGPTREPIDPVRYIGNRSSGKMGYAVAQAALDAGHEVTLVSGPVSLEAPEGARVVRVQTAAEMFDAVHANLAGIDVAVLCAAVADFKIKNAAPEKIKKNDGVPTLELEPTRDILASLGKISKKNFLLAGFAAETNDLEKNARKKLEAKRCDVVIGNRISPSNPVFERDENEVVVFFKDGSRRALPRDGKANVARALVKIFASMK